jgi:2-polyprenyl-3-methyl-5-hydroxy-6-metoxy-1,4-benzoquinol methylase
MEKDYLWWTLEEVAKEHDNLNKSYFEQKKINIPYFETLKKAIVYIILHENKLYSCLDVGCGAAWMAVYLMQEGFKNNILYEGLDISNAMIEKAKNNFPQGKYYIEDILEFDSHDVWDIVMANGSIEHFLNYKDFINKLINLSNDWIIINKIFFQKDDKDTEQMICPTYAGHKQTRMVLNYNEFINTLLINNFEIKKRFDLDDALVSCIIGRRIK